MTAILEPLVGHPPNGEPTARAPGVYREAGGLYGEQEELWDELDIFGAQPAPRFTLEEQAPEPESGRTERDRVLALVGDTPVSADDLSRQAELPIRIVQTVLVELGVDGLVDRQQGVGFSRRR